MSKYKFGNFEVEIDPTDVAFVEKYEVVAENYKSKVDSIPKKGKASEIIKIICNIFFEIFDELFGKNTSKQMFEGTQSVDLCVKAFKSLVEIMNNYNNTLKQLTKDKGNRITKRVKK